MKRREALGRIANMAAGAILTACGVAKTDGKQVSTPEWGIFTGGGIEADKEMEKRLGKNADIITTFAAWVDGGGLSPAVAEHGQATGKRINLFWEAYSPGVKSTDETVYSNMEILSGRHDEYIAGFAQSLKEYGGRVDLYMWPEVNGGDWVPQSEIIPRNRGAFVEAWKHVAGFFEEVPNVRLGLSLNSSGPELPENEPEIYFAGKEYVGVVGIDGFNFGPPQERQRSFGEIFEPMLEKVKEWEVPITIPSMASAPFEGRPNWIREALTRIKNEPAIVGFNWFGEDKSGKGEWERDWSLADEESFEAFRSNLP